MTDSLRYSLQLSIQTRFTDVHMDVLKTHILNQKFLLLMVFQVQNIPGLHCTVYLPLKSHSLTLTPQLTVTSYQCSVTMMMTAPLP